MRADYIIEPYLLKETKLMNNPLIFDQLTVFEISGCDARTFLENQIVSELTNDENVIYSAICNPKGRILYSLLIFSQSDNYFIAVNDDLSDNFFHYVSLRKFRMDFKIDKTDYRVQCDSSEPDETQVSCLSLKQKDNTNSIATHDQFWRFLFESELPWITQATTELFIPQHVNFDQKNIIAFDKGCYPGQEIIARLHFIGKVKKRMRLMRSEEPLTNALGQSVSLKSDESKVEICSPSISSNGVWLTQAICTVE